MGSGLKRWTGINEGVSDRRSEETAREQDVSPKCSVLARLQKTPERLVNAAVLGDMLVRVYETGVFLDGIAEGRVLGRYRAREGVFTASCSYLKA